MGRFVEWIRGRMSAPWWQGVSVMLAVVSTAMTMLVAVFLFQIQQGQEELQRESEMAWISLVAGAHDPQNEGSPWGVSIKLVNQGPDSADFVKLVLKLGSRGVYPFSTENPGWPTNGRAQLVDVSSTGGPLGYCTCDFTFDVAHWQVGEELLFNTDFTVAEEMAPVLSRLEERDEAVVLLAPVIYVYETPTTKAAFKWDKTNLFYEQLRDEPFPQVCQLCNRDNFLAD